MGERAAGHEVDAQVCDSLYVVRASMPEHSVFARPSMDATAFAMASWSMLSSMMMSALAAIASSTCVNVSHSTSISRTNGAWARAASMASRTPPAAAMWLSFSSTPSERL